MVVAVTLTASQISTISGIMLNASQAASNAVTGYSPSASHFTNPAVVNSLNQTSFISYPANFFDPGVGVLDTINQIHVRYFTNTQIVGLNTTQVIDFNINIGNMTTSQMQYLNITQLRSLTNTQVSSLTTTNNNNLLSALNTTQISSFLPSQIPAIDVSKLNITQISVLNSTQVAALTATQLSTVTNNNNLYNLLSSTQKQYVNPNNVPLTLAVINNLTPTQIAKLNPTTQVPLISTVKAASSIANTANDTSFALQSLTVPQIQGFTGSQIPRFTPVQIAAFTGGDTPINQIASFTANQLPYFNTTQMASFTPSQLTFFNSTQIRVFNTTQLQALDYTSQISKLASSSLSTFVGSINPTLVPSFNATYNSYFLPGYNATQISYLNSTQISSMTVSQVNALTQTQVSGLNTTQLRNFGKNIYYFSANQIPYFNTTQISCLNTTQVASLSMANLAALTYGVNNSYQQIQALTGTQIGAITVRSGVFNANQIQAFTVSQVPYFNISTLSSIYGNFTQSQLNAISSNQVASYDTAISSSNNSMSIIFSSPNAKYTNIYQKLTPVQLTSLSTGQYNNIKPYVACPTITSVTAGTASCVVNFTGPVVGGLSITGYVAKAYTLNGSTYTEVSSASRASSPITISSLTAGTTYYISAYATYSSGNYQASGYTTVKSK